MRMDSWDSRTPYMAASEYSGETQGRQFWTQKIPQGIHETEGREDKKLRSTFW
jgi:hypothetical protein